jgi:uncharacterized protein (DUF2235 family)
MSSPDPAVTTMQRRPVRNVVLCLDGTNDEIGRGLPSNPAKVFEMLDLDHPDDQVAYYDPGIGTLPATNARGQVEQLWSRATQLAFGAGLVGKLAEAYTWLMEHYQPGDKVYVFGFSRGAYTARALVAMVGRPGLLRSGSSHLVRYAVLQYAREGGASDRAIANAQQFADALCWGTDAQPMNRPGEMSSAPDAQACKHSIPIEYLGLWDTVRATGLGGFGQTDWPDTDELWNVKRLRHAMSIDEWRPLYKPVPVLRTDDAFEQAWFAGVHSDVGGTFPNSELATVALKWVFDEVADKLLLRDEDPATAYQRWCHVDPAFAHGPINRMSAAWLLAGWRTRRSVPGDAVLHESVRLRREHDRDYGHDLPTPGRYTDPDWAAPRIAPQPAC